MILRHQLTVVVALLIVGMGGMGRLHAVPGDDGSHQTRQTDQWSLRGGSGGLFDTTSPGDILGAESPSQWPLASVISEGKEAVGPLLEAPCAVPHVSDFQLMGRNALQTPPDWGNPVVRTADLLAEVEPDDMSHSVLLLGHERDALMEPSPRDDQLVRLPAVGTDSPVGDTWYEKIGPSLLAESIDDSVLELPSPLQPTLAARLGYWTVQSKGNPVKVGEFQSLDSSLFVDVDGLHTDGLTTWDYYARLLDNDAPQAGLRFYAPTWRAKTRYQGYLRRLDSDPYSAYVDFDQQPARPLPAPPENFRVMKEDQTVGDDFAIRVQELDTSFSGRLTDHVNWRLKVWGMRKHGERQAVAVAHCFTAPNATDTNGNPVGGNACHALIQSQRIDWLTAEIEPAIEAHYGPLTVEYARTMRGLTTDDQLVTRPYDRLGFSGNLSHNVVPENHTQIDRLKVGLRLPNRRDGYARLYSGRTSNQLRDVDRDFRGLDMRITDRSVHGLTIAGYVRSYHQTGELPTSLTLFEDPANFRAPIGYDRTVLGASVTWRPFLGERSLRSRLRLGSRYEYREIDRENAIFEEQLVTADNSFTKSNRVHFLASMNWTPLFQSYVRYRITFTDDPLFAAPIGNTTVNTSLPTEEHSLRFGNTWAPANNFFLHGMFGLNNGRSGSSVADFTEDRYDLVFTAWYAPTPRWSLSGGLSFYANWIDQDITLGSKSNPAALPWQYGGRSDVVNFGTTYAWTNRLILSGTLDFVRGRNALDPLVPWPDLWTYSDVNVETTRFGFGLDYSLAPTKSLYFRYQLFDYDDRADQVVGGTADMYLFGGTATF